MQLTNKILSDYTPISLSEMDEVKLLNRVDTKFVLSLSQFNDLLRSISNDYRVLEIDGKRSARYKSLYFDTDNFDYYHHHHNGFPDRFKVRIRRYLDSDLCFLEIKHKKKGRTDKKRIKIHDFELNLSENSRLFIKEHIPNVSNLSPSLWNNFERITLVNNERKERLTFDIGLNFNREIDSDEQIGYSDIVIAEVKQEREDRTAPVMRTLKQMHVRQARISKYCIGMGLIKHNLKKNRFKQKYLLINKISQL